MSGRSKEPSQVEVCSPSSSGNRTIIDLIFEITQSPNGSLDAAPSEDDRSEQDVLEVGLFPL